MRCLVPSLLCIVTIVSISAAEVAPPAAPTQSVIIAEQAPDLARLREHLLQGPLGKIWALPELALLKQRLDDQVAQLDAQTGIDAWALLADLEAFRGEILAAPNRGGGRPPLGGRFALSLSSQAEALWSSLIDIGHGAADQPLNLGGLTCKRDGHWLLGADDGAPRSIAAVATAPADADFWATVDVEAMCRAYASDEASAVTNAFGLGTLDYTMVLGAEGAREITRIHGAQLPLAALDVAALAALPADAILVDALGIDGAQLDAQLAALAKTSARIAYDIAVAETACKDRGLGSPHALLRSIAGTAAIAVTSGSPFPGMTLMVPASPELDRLLDQLASESGFPLAQARGQALTIPLKIPVPITVQVRRTATHWVVSTDALLLERLAADAKPTDGFDAKAKIALALGGQGEARALLWQDNQAVARLAQAGVTLASVGQRRGRGGDQAQLMQEIARALGAAAPKLEATVGALVVDAEGATLRGRNLVMQTVIVAIGAGVALPKIVQMRAAALRTESGNNERLFSAYCLLYSNEHNWKWPLSLEALVKEPEYELPPTAFSSPSAPEVAGAYLYVRPGPMAGETQPVIVEDPACNHGSGSMVAYASGHVEFVRGTALWDEARRLSQLPKAKDAGIAADDWHLEPKREPAQNRGADLPPGPPPGKAEF